MPVARLALAALLAFAAPALAETPANPPAAEVSVGALGEVMRFDDLFAVLRDEGVAHAETMATDMFPGGGGPGWDEAVAAIYDAPALTARFEAALSQGLADDPAALQEMIGFFGSDLGRRIVGLEIDARRAFLDTATEEAARVAADRLAADRDPRHAQLGRYIAAGDLIEMNVAGALSGNLAFMQGMAASGAYGNAMPEDQIMSDVWAQESQIREDSSTWLYAYLGLAYAPLSDAELDSYTAFFESPAGKKLNAALFTAFDQVFRQVSQDLGRAAGLAMQGSDI